MFRPRDRQPAPSIISARRRTTISPPSTVPWLNEPPAPGRRQGPETFIFSGQLQTVSLEPQDVHSIVYWSKHYGAFLRHVDALKALGSPRCCRCTRITGAPRTLEPPVPDSGSGVQGLPGAGGAEPGPRHVRWRASIRSWGRRDSNRVSTCSTSAITAALPGATARCFFSFATVFQQAPAPPAPGKHPLHEHATGRRAPPGDGPGRHRRRLRDQPACLLPDRPAEPDTSTRPTASTATCSPGSAPSTHCTPARARPARSASIAGAARTSAHVPDALRLWFGDLLRHRQPPDGAVRRLHLRGPAGAMLVKTNGTKLQ